MSQFKDFGGHWGRGQLSKGLLALQACSIIILVRSLSNTVDVFCCFFFNSRRNVSLSVFSIVYREVLCQKLVGKWTTRFVLMLQLSFY